MGVQDKYVKYRELSNTKQAGKQFSVSRGFHKMSKLFLGYACISSTRA